MTILLCYTELISIQRQHIISTALGVIKAINFYSDKTFFSMFVKYPQLLLYLSYK